MLRGGEHRGRDQRCSLETGDSRRRERVPDGWILSIAFVGPPPPVVARHANTGCERPADARSQHLLAGDVLLLLDEGRVAARAHTDVVRGNGRAWGVGVPVDSVEAIEGGGPQAALPRETLEVFDHRL